MQMPAEIKKHLPSGTYTLDTTGCSQANVMIFDECVLKVEKDCNSSSNELNMMRWLQGRLPVPQVIAAAQRDELRYLLMSKMPGRYLCDAAMLDDQEQLAELVADGLRRMWTVDVSNCPTDRSLHAKFMEIEAGIRSGSITMEQPNTIILVSALRYRRCQCFSRLSEMGSRPCSLCPARISSAVTP